MPQTKQARPKVAISACLNGERVRYDGADNALTSHRYLLENALTLVPLCPEVGAGMSVPRPPIQLQKSTGRIEVIGRDDKTINATAALTHYREQSFSNIENEICGYIFKSRSPSCGLASAPIFNSGNQLIGVGSGMQAYYFKQKMPWLPCTEETDLIALKQCEQFIFLCKIAFDLGQATEEAPLQSAHKHYRLLYRQLTKDQQYQLDSYSQHNDIFNYRTLLLRATEQWLRRLAP